MACWDTRCWTQGISLQVTSHSNVVDLASWVTQLENERLAFTVTGLKGAAC